LKIGDTELFRDDGKGFLHLFGNLPHRLIQGEAGFDANHHQVECVGQTEEDIILALFRDEPQHKRGQVEAEAGADDRLKNRVFGNAAHQQAAATENCQANDQTHKLQAQVNTGCCFTAKTGRRQR